MPFVQSARHQQHIWLPVALKKRRSSGRTDDQGTRSVWQLIAHKRLLFRQTPDGQETGKVWWTAGPKRQQNRWQPNENETSRGLLSAGPKRPPCSLTLGGQETKSGWQISEQQWACCWSRRFRWSGSVITPRTSKNLGCSNDQAHDYANHLFQDLGRMTDLCKFCKAFKWHSERPCLFLLLRQICLMYPTVDLWHRQIFSLLNQLRKARMPVQMYIVRAWPLSKWPCYTYMHYSRMVWTFSFAARKCANLWDAPLASLLLCTDCWKQFFQMSQILICDIIWKGTEKFFGLNWFSNSYFLHCSAL